MNVQSIRAYLRRPEPELFDELARELLRAQTTRSGRTDEISPGDLPADASGWHDAEPSPARLVDQSSGAPADDETLDEVIQAQWRALRYPPGARVLLLMACTPGAGTRLVSAIQRGAVDPGDIVHPVRQDRADSLAVRSWLGARQRGSPPAWIVTSGTLGEDLVRDLERRRLRFRLPPGSRLVHFCSSGQLVPEYPRRSAEITNLLGVPPELQTVLVETGTLASLIAVEPDRAGSLRLAAPPPWMRYRVVETTESDSAPRTARLAVFDLATTLMPPLQEFDWAVAEADGALLLQIRD